jgi:hypothetical protein
MKRILLSLLAIVFLSVPSHAQQAMDNAAVLKLQAAGLGDDLIVTTINNSPGHYSMSTDDMIALKKAGVSDKVMGAMVQKNAGVPAVAPAAISATPASALPPGITDVGVYYQDKTGQWSDMVTEIVNYKTGGVLKGLATGGIVKGDLNGNIAGKASKLQLQSPVSVIIYALEGQSPSEYQLLRLHQNSDNREFRSKTGGIIHASTGANKDQVEFDAKRIASRVYQITLPASIGKGEYGFLPPGTANSGGNAASAGKIYTFALVE